LFFSILITAKQAKHEYSDWDKPDIKPST